MDLEQSFESYSSPNPLSTYSSHYFNNLTFKSVSSVDYPEIAPPGSVSQWYFHAEVPGSGQATVIMPREIIFHVDDLLPLIREMEDAYENGSRSVSIEASVHGENMYKTYHFAKVSFM
jgi:hypothetical protein